ncbi:putative nudix hydrolase 7 [Podospora aff. communis PSN243]|uniref:Nudix hydrolase 7 n=1 Tax=Podospora aff. communis PSN243 TaxID=3040156 RepID=A0AAV9GE95_9PEZI|nr:putative nudix hydrolase 7 [Podospora aff. communis PSN243]
MMSRRSLTLRSFITSELNWPGHFLILIRPNNAPWCFTRCGTSATSQARGYKQLRNNPLPRRTLAPPPSRTQTLGITPRPQVPPTKMSAGQKRASSSGPEGGKKERKRLPVRPSSSILLLSPTNQVLLLHRVQTSTSFASAHVFPGGNLSSFHEGELPPLESEEIHRDSEAYRLAAVRETFEESGILLARRQGGSELLSVSSEVMEAGRKEVHGNRVKFVDWLRSIGGTPDLDNLIPFTRWITPIGVPKRFSTQMYLYMLPLSAPAPGAPEQQTIIHTPTHDGGLEHTAATFDDAKAWVSKAEGGQIVLFPPQLYLLNLVSEFTKSAPEEGSATAHYQAQRDALLKFLRKVPTSRFDAAPNAKVHPTAQIPWAEKVMSPTSLFLRRGDKRVVLGLDKPGPELKGSGRGGDWDRVVLVEFKKEGPTRVEVRWRDEVLKEEREAVDEGQGAKL